jgi:hypothetical protein
MNMAASLGEARASGQAEMRVNALMIASGIRFVLLRQRSRDGG